MSDSYLVPVDSEAIRVLMESQRLTQQDLGRRSEVSQSLISRILSRRVKSVRYAKLERLANALGAAPEKLSPDRSYSTDSDLGRGEQRLVDGVFETLTFHPYPTLLLLAQEGYELAPVLEAVIARARARHDLDEAHHLRPPGSPETGLGRYFAHLGRQCRMTEVIGSSSDWEAAVNSRLSTGNRLFLLISGFDRGAPDGGRLLGQVLRGLSERYGQALWLVLCGGEGLARLRYEDGVHSLLNVGERVDWPEPTADDVLAWQRREVPGLALDEGGAREILELCGAHPRLIRQSLRWRSSSQKIGSRLLAQDEGLWALFTRYRSDPDAGPEICKWLQLEDLGPAQPWPGDKLLRRLYWRNALKAKDGRLVWRCGAIREAGRRVLVCE